MYMYIAYIQFLVDNMFNSTSILTFNSISRYMTIIMSDGSNEMHI